MAQYASNVEKITHKITATGIVDRFLVRREHAPMTEQQEAALSLHAGDLPTLDAFVPTSMPGPWAAWWAGLDDEDREAFRVVLA